MNEEGQGKEKGKNPFFYSVTVRLYKKRGMSIKKGTPQSISASRWEMLFLWPQSRMDEEGERERDKKVQLKWGRKTTFGRKRKHTTRIQSGAKRFVGRAREEKSADLTPPLCMYGHTTYTPQYYFNRGVRWVFAYIENRCLSRGSLFAGMSRSIYPLAGVYIVSQLLFRCSFHLWQQII